MASYDNASDEDLLSMLRNRDLDTSGRRADQIALLEMHDKDEKQKVLAAALSKYFEDLKDQSVNRRAAEEQWKEELRVLKAKREDLPQTTLSLTIEGLQAEEHTRMQLIDIEEDMLLEQARLAREAGIDYVLRKEAADVARARKQSSERRAELSEQVDEEKTVIIEETRLSDRIERLHKDRAALKITQSEQDKVSELRWAQQLTELQKCGMDVSELQNMSNCLKESMPMIELKSMTKVVNEPQSYQSRKRDLEVEDGHLELVNPAKRLEKVAKDTFRYHADTNKYSICGVEYTLYTGNQFVEADQIYRCTSPARRLSSRRNQYTMQKFFHRGVAGSASSLAHPIDKAGNSYPLRTTGKFKGCFTKQELLSPDAIMEWVIELEHENTELTRD